MLASKFSLATFSASTKSSPTMSDFNDLVTDNLRASGSSGNLIRNSAIRWSSKVSRRLGVDGYDVIKLYNEVNNSVFGNAVTEMTWSDVCLPQKSLGGKMPVTRA